MAKDTDPPERLVTTQEEVDHCRDIVQRLPDGVLTPEEREQAVAGINRLGEIHSALKKPGCQVNQLTAILRGGESHEADETDTHDEQAAEADEQQSR